MNHKPLPIGIDNFEMLVTRGYYFVDKTLFIKELLDKKSAVNLFTRPRRFGKTLSLSMMQYFFEDMRDPHGTKQDNHCLFDGLKIMGTGEAYTRHMGQYPVISLTLKEANQADFDTAFYYIRSAIADEYKRHRYILESDLLPSDKEKYEIIMSEKDDKNSYGQSLKFLSSCLETYYGKKTIILIDEYDVPLESAYTNGFYEEMVAFIRTLFSSALKTNASLEFAVITGCLRISKESIFTGLNNLDVISILNHNYGEYFGFTDEEVKKICSDYDLTDSYDTARKWYNGYLFGNSNVYNPWSTIMFIKAQAASPQDVPKPYWANTSSNIIVRRLIEMADIHVKKEIEDLITGGTIEKPIHEDITYGEVYKNMDHLWNFLLFTGYLRKADERIDEETGIRYLTMVIPNEEVRYIYRTAILTWFDQKVNAIDRAPLYQAFLEKNCDTIEALLKQQLKESISYHDSAEQFYHGFMVGMLGGFTDYLMFSNREAGDGRADLVLEPVDEQMPVIILEFKKADKLTQMDSGCEAALRQIDEKHYDEPWRNEGYEHILKYGVCFCKKNCRVRAGE